MGYKYQSLFVMALLLSFHFTPADAFWYEIAGAVATAGAVCVGGPAALALVGFGSAGIAGGSMAAGMMSAAATTGYGAATVAALQSAGAAGIPAVAAVVSGVVGAGAGHAVSRAVDDDADYN